MADVTVLDMIKTAEADDAVSFRDMFDQLMGEKIVAAIADKKIEVAKNYFNTTGESSDEDTEENS